MGKVICSATRVVLREQVKEKAKYDAQTELATGLTGNITAQ
jgi:hypothetical protein